MSSFSLIFCSGSGKPFGCGSKLDGGGVRRLWSMFPLARVPFWYRFFEPQPFRDTENPNRFPGGRPALLGGRRALGEPSAGLHQSGPRAGRAGGAMAMAARRFGFENLVLVFRVRTEN